MTKKTFTLFLAKQDVENFDDLLSDAGQNRLADPTTRQVDADDFLGGAKLFVFVGQDHTPVWLRDLRQVFPIPGAIETSSAGALLAFRAAGRLFACTFSHGWMYLDEDKLEADFGLRVAINAVDENKLNRLDRANLGDALRAVSHSPFQRDFKSFGLDDALDLVRKVSGSAKVDAAADAIVGSRSLKLSGELDLNELGELAEEALTYFLSTDYRDTGFSVLDVVAPIADRQLVRILDQLAVVSIREGHDEFELGLPVNYDDDGVSYRFIGPGLRRRYSDLLLRNYTSALGTRLADLTLETLREHKIGALTNDARPERKWSIRSALIGSLVHGDGRYAINEGEWYRVDEAFKLSIERSFTDLVGGWSAPPTPLRKIYDNRENATYQSEESYNTERAAALGYLLLDQQLVAIPGVQRSRFEPCDLLDVVGKRLIHVKKSSRRSNVLSHFFKQGGNSGQQFKRFPAAWTGLYTLVEQRLGLQTANQLRAANERAEQPWTVEFWIADTPRADGSFNIPFFSKITLRDEASNLAAMNYRVILKFIGLEAEHIGV
ncbi:DUF6119 family protein [Mesorhizobium sp.]|uniref:DUF6119 family protein n=1 Tax=Mesorhizobium sp. TaxID=1871066 RepID=UPI000FE737DC|nr:DUF6119 family protein [Mesorhizobium sp.]RWA80462.1 MAG: hypothetical protein EOQ30_21875 [Mesorhizobium sp.]